ncbi:HAD family phosphatase [Alphaproteobacteria bacterium]|nr:HAD family phosphatase [Alphaproteobacteria bacterium]
MIKNIIFDFDGVLVDSEMLVAQSFCRYFRARNIQFTENDFSIFAGNKTVNVISELSAKFNIDNEKGFFNDIMQITNEIYVNELTSVPGALEFLESTAYNYFIGSNSGKERIVSGLKKVKFDKFFSVNKVFSFDMIGVAKPEPDIYLAVINANNLNKEETIILEDSEVGVKAGVASGVKVVGLTAGGHWYKNRSTQELLDAGAFVLIDNYKKLHTEINKL